jgi:TM2 domain-containing membrane protein YozV
MSCEDAMADHDGQSSDLPPHPLDTKWMLSVDSTSYGPYSGHQMSEFIEEGRIITSSRVARVGDREFFDARDDPILSSLFNSRASEASAKSRPGNNATGPIGHSVAAAEELVGDSHGEKSPGLALLLSLLFCGAGQIYNERITKGLIMLALCIVTWFVLLGWVVMIWSMIDAYNEANEINRRMGADQHAENPGIQRDT